MTSWRNRVTAKAKRDPICRLTATGTTVKSPVLTLWWWAWRSNSRQSRSTSSPRSWRTRSRLPLWSGWTGTKRQIWGWSRWPRYVCSPAPASPVWSPRTRTCWAARRCSGTWPGLEGCPPLRRTWWTVCPTWCSASSARNLRRQTRIITVGVRARACCVFTLTKRVAYIELSS